MLQERRPPFVASAILSVAGASVWSGCCSLSPSLRCQPWSARRPRHRSGRHRRTGRRHVGSRLTLSYRPDHLGQGPVHPHPPRHRRARCKVAARPKPWRWLSKGNDSTRGRDLPLPEPENPLRRGTLNPAAQMGQRHPSPIRDQASVRGPDLEPRGGGSVRCAPGTVGLAWMIREEGALSRAPHRLMLSSIILFVARPGISEGDASAQSGPDCRGPIGSTGSILWRFSRTVGGRRKELS